MSDSSDLIDKQMRADERVCFPLSKLIMFPNDRFVLTTKGGVKLREERKAALANSSHQNTMTSAWNGAGGDVEDEEEAFGFFSSIQAPPQPPADEAPTEIPLADQAVKSNKKPKKRKPSNAGEGAEGEAPKKKSRAKKKPNSTAVVAEEAPDP